MKTLKEYIKEGILDIEDNMENLTIESLIEDFIEENYRVEKNLQIKKKVDKYIVSTNGSVEVTNKNITELTNNVFEWGEVMGTFDCNDCISLKSLTGAPKEAGDFFCNGCTSLKDLKGAPEKVKGWFSCGYCNSLKSLEGAPEKVEDFFCHSCISLKDLIGAPRKLNSFNCTGCTSLKSLKGAPKEIVSGIICTKCGKKFTEEDVKKVCNVTSRLIYV